MPVTSSTIGGVNTWTFSGAVTDAELKTAWAALIVNGVYVLNRAIYLDNTADLTGCTGGFLVDFGTQVNPAIILSTTRDKTKSTFRNFTFLQRTGLTVTQRIRFVLTWDGTNLGTPTGSDGLSQNGGGMIYGVPGNPGGGDPRYLNEMSFAGLEGVTIYSQEFTEQELQPVVGQTSVLKGITFEKCFGFPQIGTPVGPVNVVVYRSNQNTQHPTQFPVRIYPALNRYASLCYVDSYVTRNNADITTRLVDAFGSNASNVATLMILNNYTRESWFGATRTNFQAVTWATTNTAFGGVLKKLQFVGGDDAVIRAYDSRSTTAAQKCKFLESGAIDFMDPSLAPTTDAQGKITLVHIGATASGTTTLPPITRYTNQRYTFQKFGFRVSVTNVDMTAGGDNDLSAFTPVIPTAQDGIVRTQAEITAATELTSFQDLLEELHVLAIGLSGSASYAGAFGGNLFTFVGGVLTTSFSAANVDATAAAKISFDSATNVLTVKASELTDNATVTKWVNASGPINLLNGAVIKGIYQSQSATSARLTLEDLTDTSVRVSTNTGTEYDFASDIDAAYVEYFGPGKTGTWAWIAERLGYQRQSGTFTPGVGGDFAESLIWLQDLGLTETSAAVLAAITDFDDPNDVLNYAAYWRTTQPGIAINKISKDGSAVSWGDANVNWVASAAVPLAYDSGTNTFTAVTTGHVAGSTLFSHRTTGLMTFGAGTNFNTAFKDVDGLRVSVTGINPQGFTVTGHLRYRKQGTTTWTNTTYTANTITLLMEEAIYDVQVRCPGYDWKTTEVDAAKTLLLDVGLQYQVSANNTPQYTMPFNAVLEAIFSYDPTSMQVAVANTTGGILQPGFAELYQATQRIMHLSGLVWSWTNPIKANATSQKIIIPTGNPLQMFLTAASNSSVKLTCPVIHEDNGQSADDRVRGNASGYSIILGSPATAESAGLQAAIVAELGGPNFATATHGLSMIKAVADLIKTATDAVKAKTDNLPAAPAAVGDAMTLTSAYDAAKTAATQTSVDAVAADVTSIKATVEAIEPTDLSGIPAAVRTELATELGRIDVAVSTRSTLTAEDVPEGLTAAEVWSATTRTLTEAPGLTTGQAEQLRKVAQLHGVGVQLVVTETTRTAGDVSQTLTTDEAGSTTVSAA